MLKEVKVVKLVTHQEMFSRKSNTLDLARKQLVNIGRLNSRNQAEFIVQKFKAIKWETATAIIDSGE